MLAVNDVEWIDVGNLRWIKLREDEQVTGLHLRVAKGGIISGRVYEKASGNGVSGIKVGTRGWGWGGGQPDRETHSDGFGRYRLAGLRQGTYHVGPADLKRYRWTKRESGDSVRVRIRPGEEIVGVDFPCVKGIIVVGRVLDNHGGAVAEAHVALTFRGLDRHGTDARGRTDSQGAFALAASYFPGASFHVVASHDSHAGSSGPHILRESGVHNLAVTLAPSGEIQGRVVTLEGGPAPYAFVRGSPLRETLEQYLEAVADAEGTFRIPNVMTGPYRLYAVGRRNTRVDQDKQAAVEVHVEPGQNLRGVQLQCKGYPGGIVAGRVTDGKGRPVRDAEVTVELGQEYFAGGIWVLPQPELHRSNTDARGHYLMVGLGHGAHKMWAEHYDYNPSAMRDIQTGNENADFVLLPKKVQLIGQVFDAISGEPVPDFAVTVRRDDLSSGYGVMRRHDDGGRFEFNGIEAGQTSVTVRAADYFPATQTVDVTPGKGPEGVLEFALERGGVIEGVVLDPARRPIPNALVFVDKKAENQWRAPSPSRHSSHAAARSLRDGTFRIDSLKPGTHTVRAYKQGYSSDTAEVSLDGPAAPRLELILSPLGTISGTVLLDGQPLPYAHVGIKFSVEGREHNGHGETTPDGAYEVTEIHPGEAIVTVGYNDANSKYHEHPDGAKPAIVEAGLTTVVDFGAW